MFCPVFFLIFRYNLYKCKFKTLCYPSKGTAVCYREQSCFFIFISSNHAFNIKLTAWSFIFWRPVCFYIFSKGQKHSNIYLYLKDAHLMKIYVYILKSQLQKPCFCLHTEGLILPTYIYKYMPAIYSCQYSCLAANGKQNNFMRHFMYKDSKPESSTLFVCCLASTAISFRKCKCTWPYLCFLSKYGPLSFLMVT